MMVVSSRLVRQHSTWRDYFAALGFQAGTRVLSHTRSTSDVAAAELPASASSELDAQIAKSPSRHTRASPDHGPAVAVKATTPVVASSSDEKAEQGESESKPSKDMPKLCREAAPISSTHEQLVTRRGSVQWGAGSKPSPGSPEGEVTIATATKATPTGTLPRPRLLPPPPGSPAPACGSHNRVELMRSHDFVCAAGPLGLGLDMDETNTVVGLVAGGNAEAQGLLRAGDVVVAVDGETLGSWQLKHVLVAGKAQHRLRVQRAPHSLGELGTRRVLSANFAVGAAGRLRGAPSTTVARGAKRDGSPVRLTSTRIVQL